MTTTTIKALSLLAILALAGCSTEQTGSTSAPTAVRSAPIAPPSLNDLGRAACHGFTLDSDTEMFVAGQGSCPDGTYVYVFTNNTARDQWAQVADSMGARVWLGERYAVSGDGGEAVYANTQQVHP